MRNIIFSAAGVASDPRVGKKFSYRPGANNNTYTGLVKATPKAKTAYKIGTMLGANKGKLAGAALIGGAGIAAARAIRKNRKAKSNSLESRLQNAKNMAQKMFR